MNRLFPHFLALLPIMFAVGEEPPTGEAVLETRQSIEQRVVPQFQEGDRICFVGDSITHAGTYHAKILLYYVTRFPDRHIDGFNCGTNGASAGGNVLLKGYEWDVLAKKPNVVTLMYGMNDVGHPLYDESASKDPDIEKKRQWALDGYSRNMTKLAEMFSGAQCRLIFITPTIYDQNGSQARRSAMGVDDALEKCALVCRELSTKFGGSLIDFHGPMQQINTEQQKRNPDYTLIGPDRIHPGEEGHLLMAYLFLMAQGVPRFVSETVIDAETGTVVKQENCQISNLSNEERGIRFESQEGSLPYPIGAQLMEKIERLVPFTEKLNKEILSVKNLRLGRYGIFIDGQQVANCSSDELASGINLANNSLTPQYKQAQAIAELVKKRCQLEAGTLRTFAGTRGFLEKMKVPHGDEDAARIAIEKEMAERKSKGLSNSHFEFYLKYSQEDRKKVEEEADGLWAKVFSANKPVVHKFEIRPIEQL